MDRKKRKTYLSAILTVILLIVYLLFLKKPAEENSQVSQRKSVDHREKDFRHNRIYYSKHAKCRMECRHIDESEVKEILDEGKINYSKSETDAKPCPKYALEGITHDKQHVRIIVGDCKTQASIITVIDLVTDFECDCK